MTSVRKKQLFYDYLAASHRWEDFANEYETARRLDLIYNRLLSDDEVRGRRLLDAGAGGGHFSAAAAERGADVWSLDMGQQLLTQVARKCRTYRIIGSIMDLPFADKSFDVVVSTEVIEHTPDPVRGVRELARVVNKAGILVITTPGRLWQPVVRLASLLRLRPFRGYENFVWPNQLIQAVVSQGFRIEWTGGFNFCPLFSARMGTVFRLCDALYGERFPWLMVNHAVRARRL